MSAIRALSLGPDGHDLALLFARLGRLSTLERFTLSAPKMTDAPSLRPITASDVVNFLSSAPNLEALTLPNRLSKIWTASDLQDVVDATELGEVKFRLVSRGKKKKTHVACSTFLSGS